MGNTIPHGDRLHECQATCPEYVAASITINHQHQDGRNCIISPDGYWRHWEYKEPGPREETPGTICNRVHPSVEERQWSGDRGEFGFPGVGNRWGAIGRMWDINPEDENNGLPDYIMRVRNSEMMVDYFGEQGFTSVLATPEAHVIMDALPQLLEKFLANNAKYALAQTHDLGLQGVIPDVNRKVSALIQRLWFGAEAGRDSTEELIEDTIGHLLLMLGKLRMEDGGGTPG